MNSESTKSGMGKDVLKLAGGTLFSQVLGIIVVPILTHIYAPAYFGLAASFSSIVGILTVISCLRYDLAILLPEEDIDAARVLGLSLIATVLVTLVVGVVFLLAGKKIALVMKTPEMEPFLWLIAPMTFLFGISQALTYWNTRIKMYGRLALARTLQSFVMSTSQVAMGFFVALKAGGLIWGMFFGALIFSGLLIWQIWVKDGDLFIKSINAKGLVDAMKRYRKFPLLDFWGSMLNVLSQQLPVLLIGIYFSQATVGHYAMANRLIYLPMTLIGGSIGQVFFQRSAEAYAKKGNTVELTEDVFRKLVTLSLFPSLMLMMTGKEIFVLVFGPDWSEAGRFVEILSPWMFFWFVASPLTALFAVTQRLESSFFVHILLLITRVVPLVVGGLLNDIYLALILFSLSGVFAYAVVGIWSVRLVEVGWRPLGYQLKKIALRSAPAILLVALAKYMLEAPDWVILLVAGIGSLEYAWHIASKEPEINIYLRSIFKRR